MFNSSHLWTSHTQPFPLLELGLHIQIWIFAGFHKIFYNIVADCSIALELNKESLALYSFQARLESLKWFFERLVYVLIFIKVIHNILIWSKLYFIVRRNIIECNIGA